MKKITLLAVLSLIAALLLGGCAGSTTTEDRLYADFEADGVTLAIGQELTDEIVDSLGTPKAVTQAPSCHYDGTDTIRQYDGYALYTYAQDDRQILYLIELSDASVSTREGASVGMTMDEITAIYGAGTAESDFMQSYEGPDGVLSISHDANGIVTLIKYGENAA